MIIRARCVLTMNGAPIEDGAVVVRDDRIEDVGEWRDVRARHSAEVVDLGESILLPGLINAHCHLDYTDLRGAIPQQASFTDWIRAINATKAEMREEDYLAAILAGIDEAARFGTTTIGNLEAFPELIAQVPEDQMRIWWFAELIAVQKRFRALDILSAISSRARVSLAPHAPYTAPKSLYSECADLVTKHKLVATTHLAESREELEMFRDASGPLFEFMRKIGRPMDDCGKQTSIALMLDRNAIDERWIVAHLNEITPDDFALLARVPKFHIVHCPRSHVFFRHSPFAFERLRELGFNICLGTDSLASNADLSLFAEMRQFAQINSAIAPRELVEMVTTRPAAALQQAETLGRIAQGFVADLTAIPFTGKVIDAFENVVSFSGEVPFRMLGGAVVRLR